MCIKDGMQLPDELDDGFHGKLIEGVDIDSYITPHGSEDITKKIARDEKTIRRCLSLIEKKHPLLDGEEE
ncbi:hypothetical protein LDC_1921 [sediment metagenome]|uniref:Uncharacterized protein n=1 Tax=sediment metagenome TaxID=749907 RepID=D9PK56_9ZZZZ